MPSPRRSSTIHPNVMSNDSGHQPNHESQAVQGDGCDSFVGHNVSDSDAYMTGAEDGSQWARAAGGVSSPDRRSVFSESGVARPRTPPMDDDSDQEKVDHKAKVKAYQQLRESPFNFGHILEPEPESEPAKTEKRGANTGQSSKADNTGGSQSKK